MGSSSAKSGFTLVELSIVLVIIGLIIGGVLVGQDLVRAAEVRATISQIEKFNQATNTFRGKYGALPGDLNAQVATQFGFSARGTQPGQGDSNGVIQGSWVGSGYGDNGGGYSGVFEGQGETVMFWVDLSYANGLNINLIDGSFSTGTSASTQPNASNSTGTSVSLWYPQAKIGRGNYFMVWSYGGTNYYSLSAVNNVGDGCNSSNANIPVKQAYDIDKKVDDGLPQSGNVTAILVDAVTFGWQGTPVTAPCFGWAGTAVKNNTPYTTATPASASTCFDNGNASGATQQYSLGQNNGSNPNCALSFKFQ